jgi:hypothetical protein
MQGASSPRVFLCYSNEDKDIARRLQTDLERDGISVFADFTRIKLGDSLPEEINAGLQESDTLVLLWSKRAANSWWVKVEWQNALKLKHRIIPCLLEAWPLPAILSYLVYLDFSNYLEGYPKLCSALGVTHKTD